MATHVLLVDDEPLLLSGWAKALGYMGYVVVTASTAKEALEACDKSAFDVIIIDYLMPTMKGVELLARIRKRLPLVRSIMISGRIDQTVDSEQIRAEVEADVYLHKPVANEQLKEALKAVMEKSGPANWQEIAKQAKIVDSKKLKSAKRAEGRLKPLLKKRPS